MKNILYIILLQIPTVGLSQDVFKDSISKKEYVFIGSIKEDSLKLLINRKVKWIKKEALVQTNKIQSKEFINLVFNNQFFFEAEGDEPFWRAEIRSNKLTVFNSTNGKRKKYDIVIKTNDGDIDRSFYFMFSDKKRYLYGLIRGLGLFPKEQKKCQLCLSEETSVYEVFINIEGVIYKGCAIISR
jgi:uncharacterized membrane protein